ncbi:hypothetical protein BDA96_10G259200 [Sorghum bicolor]|uniref:Uncharacterized protein n=1 Tax=Sorghum bicolor TaxID=4558 RepID=A0A921Q6Q0_SORBI|nr:hypothetical protein BDA96_10G259200 [Sorghum bicolor]
MSLEGAAGVPQAMSLWRTPTPYILLVIGSMMFLIALVLLVLICARNSRRSSRRRGSSDDDEEEAPSSARMPVLKPLDREPKVAVIMAGERAPSFLASAKPLPLAWGADEAGGGGGAGAVPYV